jgi:serine phosphatase RsbU (regulator of sigma subunit)
LSLCAGGIVTRILLADISGHGEVVADSSKALRRLLGRFMNAKSQKNLVVELNRQFTELEQTGRFATAIVATYLSRHRKLMLTNAGHPRPLLFRAVVGHWQYLNPALLDNRRAVNLPLGVDIDAKYESCTLSIDVGDWLVMYSDAFTEVGNTDGKLLGERGLLSLVEKIPLSRSCHQFGQELMAGVEEYANHSPPNDDATLIVIRFGDSYRTPRIIERLRGYGKVIRYYFS